MQIGYFEGEYFFKCTPAVGNHSFLNLEIHKCAETIQGRKLYEEIRYIVSELVFLLCNEVSSLGWGNYSREETI